MRDYEVMLSPAAREFLLELEWEERELLMRAMLDQLKPDIAPAVSVAGRILRCEIYGYNVDYRNLQEGEKRRFNLRNGKYVVSISLVTKGFWDRLWSGL